MKCSNDSVRHQPLEIGQLSKPPQRWARAAELTYGWNPRLTAGSGREPDPPRLQPLRPKGRMPAGPVGVAVVRSGPNRTNASRATRSFGAHAVPPMGRHRCDPGAEEPASMKAAAAQTVIDHVTGRQGPQRRTPSCAQGVRSSPLGTSSEAGHHNRDLDTTAARVRPAGPELRPHP